MSNDAREYPVLTTLRWDEDRGWWCDMKGQNISPEWMWNRAMELEAQESRLVEELRKLVNTIEQWEEDVRKVIQIPIEHGMDLRGAKAILAAHKETTGE